MPSLLLVTLCKLKITAYDLDELKASEDPQI